MAQIQKCSCRSLFRFLQGIVPSKGQEGFYTGTFSSDSVTKSNRLLMRILSGHHLSESTAGSKLEVAGQKNEERPIPGVLAWNRGGRGGTHHCETNREPWQSLSSLYYRSSTNPDWLNLVCVYSASPISKMKLHDSGIYPNKHLLSSLENPQHVGSPCALWTSYLAHLFPSKQLSHSSILGHLENPGYHVLYPQMFLAFIMFRALSVNVSSPDMDADFRD